MGRARGATSKGETAHARTVTDYRQIKGLIDGCPGVTIIHRRRGRLRVITRCPTTFGLRRRWTGGWRSMHTHHDQAGRGPNDAAELRPTTPPA